VTGGRDVADIGRDIEQTLDRLKLANDREWAKIELGPGRFSGIAAEVKATAAGRYPRWVCDAQRSGSKLYVQLLSPPLP
jgi:hypothetical protein